MVVPVVGAVDMLSGIGSSPYPEQQRGSPEVSVPRQLLQGAFGRVQPCSGVESIRGLGGGVSVGPLLLSEMRSTPHRDDRMPRNSGTPFGHRDFLSSASPACTLPTCMMVKPELQL